MTVDGFFHSTFVVAFININGVVVAIVANTDGSDRKTIEESVVKMLLLICPLIMAILHVI